MKVTTSILSRDDIPKGDNVAYCQPINMYMTQALDPDRPGKSIIDLYFDAPSGNVYHFNILPDDEHGKLSDLLREALKNVAMLIVSTQEDISATNEMKNMLSTAIEFAEKEESSEIPPERRIYYRLMNGNLIYTDGGKIDWNDHANHIPDRYKTLDDLRTMIRTILTSDTIKTDAGDESAVEYVKNTIQHFFEDNKLDIDYSMFELDSISDRERLIVKMLDIFTFYYEGIVIASAVSMQNRMIEAIRKQGEKKEEK